tara:strand:+ start:370 stop:555 length:186 start_codon:yes stop_codon:yes gene_type:complete
MNKLPLDSQLDPEKVEALILIDKMLKSIDNPDISPMERELMILALETLAKTYVQAVDPTEN